VTTFIILGVSICICILLFVLDERRRRNLDETIAQDWITYPSDTKTDSTSHDAYLYNEIGLRLIFYKLPRIKTLGKFSSLIIFFVIIPWLLLLSASLVDGTLTLQGDSTGLLEDYLHPCIFLTIAVTFYIFQGVMNSVPRTFMSLGQSNDRSERSKTFLSQQTTSVACYLMQTPQSRGWKGMIMDLSVLALAASLIAIVFVADAFNPPETVSHTSQDYFWGHLVFIVIYTIMLCYFVRIMFGYVIRLILSMQAIGRRLSEENILRVQPIHPDNAGGLGEFGKLALRIDLLLMPLVAILVIWYVVTGTVDVPVILAMVFAILALPVFFFLPLRGLNQAMSRAKQQEVGNLSDQFYEHWWTMKNWLEGKEDVTDEEGQRAQESLERIILLYDRAARMPVWPFDRSTIGRVITSVGVPVLTVIARRLFQ
jgi:hypothetical protein